MKKLLLVLLVVALASFLFVGCVPTTPAEGEGEGEGETEVAVCPTVAVTSQVAVDGKTFIKEGVQTITVTFAVPTEPVSVYVADALAKGSEMPGEEVVVYANADKTVYTGTFGFDGDCDEGYIYVDTCEACAYCKYPYIVDSSAPATAIKISTEACTCDGCDLIFETPAALVDCGVITDCCGDDCSGFASYTIDLYTEDPFNECCEVPCVTPEYSCAAGVACPVDCTLSCLPAGDYYVVVTLLDAVGNSQRYYAIVTLGENPACSVSVVEYVENDMGCTDWLPGQALSDTDTVIGACLGNPVPAIAG